MELCNIFFSISGKNITANDNANIHINMEQKIKYFLLCTVIFFNRDSGNL